VIPGTEKPIAIINLLPPGICSFDAKLGAPGETLTLDKATEVDAAPLKNLIEKRLSHIASARSRKRRALELREPEGSKNER
jgi:hypothetical protein